MNEARRRQQVRRRYAAAMLAWTASACGGEPGLELVGTVERTMVELVAPLSEVIVEIPKKRGDTVEAGDLIVRLDPTLAKAEVAQAEARIAAARTARLVSRNDLDRIEQLRDRGVASEQELERGNLSRQEAEARHRGAEALLAAANKRLADLSLRSPTIGVLDQLPFDSGERVPAGATVAVILAAGDPWVRVWIPETHRVRLVRGTPMQVFVDGLTEPIAASVLDVAHDAEFTPHYALTERDRIHLVYEARVVLHDAPANLPAGMPARVVMATEGDTP